MRAAGFPARGGCRSPWVSSTRRTWRAHCWSRVDHADFRSGDLLDQWDHKRIVGAAEHDGIGALRQHRLQRIFQNLACYRSIQVTGLDLLPTSPGQVCWSSRVSAAKRSTSEAYSCPWKVAGVASTATTLLCECSAAGLTAGSMPTNGVWGNVWRRYCKAAAEAALQATTTSLAPWSSRKRVISSANAAHFFQRARTVRARAPGQRGRSGLHRAALPDRADARIAPPRPNRRCQSVRLE